MRGFFAFSLALLLAASSQPSLAQNSGPSITPLQRTTVSGSDTLEAVTVMVMFEPQGTTGWHTHPGDEYATLIEGTLEIRYKDKPPRRVNAGEAYHNVRGIAHETVNIGKSPARVVSTFIVDKGKPLLQPLT